MRQRTTAVSTRGTIRPMNNEQRMKMFGRFAFKPEPVIGNQERVRVTDGWAKENLVSVPVDLGIATPKNGTVLFHRAVAPRFLELIEEWRRLGLMPDVVTWNGSYAPRYIRGSQVNLSAHSWASAFDINAAHNRLNTAPAALGAKGSVMRLVPVAEKLGFFWGGHMTRVDAMHFELAKL